MNKHWNIMLATDSYKVSHTKMYPEGMTYMESYFEARGGEFPYTLFFGLQYTIKEYLLGIQVTREKIDEAITFYTPHFGNDKVFDPTVWEHILKEHGGILPIAIEAVSEGSIVPTGNILYKIYNTDPKCAKLVNWIETLLMKTWYPITIATNSMAGYEVLEYFRTIASEASNVDFSLIDFGYRGVASEEQAWIGGAAHLLSFKGSDNVAGIRMLMHYYNAPMCGFSVPASEHSTMVAGTKENEVETYKRILRLYPTGIVSIVSDTWDVYNVCNFLSSDSELKKLILERDGKLVIRPDSGEPREVLEKCLNILAEGFGYTTFKKKFTDDKGIEIELEYKTLNAKIGLLQGDGIDIQSMARILDFLTKKGWSLDNFVFGSGGGLLQKVNRDTIKAAIKASYIEVNEIGIDIFKDPITSKADSKKSKKGKLYLVKNEEGYKTINHHDVDNIISNSKDNENPCFRIRVSGDVITAYVNNELGLVYKNGELCNEISYAQILENIKIDKEFIATIEKNKQEKQIV